MHPRGLLSFYSCLRLRIPWIASRSVLKHSQSKHSDKSSRRHSQSTPRRCIATSKWVTLSDTDLYFNSQQQNYEWPYFSCVGILIANGSNAAITTALGDFWYATIRLILKLSLWRLKSFSCLDGYVIIAATQSVSHAAIINASYGLEPGDVCSNAIVSSFAITAAESCCRSKSVIANVAPYATDVDAESTESYASSIDTATTARSSAAAAERRLK